MFKIGPIGPLTTYRTKIRVVRLTPCQTDPAETVAKCQCSWVHQYVKAHWALAVNLHVDFRSASENIIRKH